MTWSGRPFLLACLMLAGWLALGPEGLLYTSMAAVTISAFKARFDLIDLPAPRRRRRPAPETDRLLRSLTSIRSEVAISAHSMREFDRTLRPRLERVMSSRLRDAHGIRLDQRPAQARELVGETVWRLLDPARPKEQSRGLRGPTAAELSVVVDRLERL